MAFTAEELLRKMFPIESSEMISLMDREKSLIHRFEELSKEETSLVDLLLSKFDKQGLFLLTERYKNVKSEKIQIRKELLQTRVQLSNLTKSITEK